MKKIISICLLVTFFSAPGFAQDESAEGTNTVQFKMGSFYISHLNFYGRTDSLNSSGFFPLAELWFNDRIYFNAAPVFVNNSISGFEYAGTVATAGYQGYSSNQKFFTHLFFTKPFYTSSSDLPQSVLKAQASSNFSYRTRILNFNAGADLRLSDKLDYGFSGGVDHLIRKQLSDKAVLVLDPSAYVYAGTQQFTKTYYKKSNYLFLPGIDQQVTEQVSKVNILSYEFSMPVILSLGKLQIIANPAFVIPQNLITVPNRPDLSERGKDLFYITAGAKITL